MSRENNLSEDFGLSFNTKSNGKSDKNRRRATVAISLIAGVFVLAFSFMLAIAPPSDFPDNKIFTIESGLHSGEISAKLKEEGFIKSDKLLLLYLNMKDNAEGVITGEYRFKRPISVFEVADRITSGEFGMEKIKVRLPEGASIAEYANILDESLPDFDKEKFLKLAEGLEGYLFPDTYFFFENVNEREIVEILQSEFEKNFSKISDIVEKSGRSKEDIVKMASILQKEAYGARDIYVISGILWNRIDKNYPMQVDAPFVYTIGKGSHSLTKSDLAMDSPYNTYVNKGLPPTPIGNPGLLALKAAAQPQKTDYMFYLHSRSGDVYYAKDFDGHKYNRRYLNK